MTRKSLKLVFIALKLVYWTAWLPCYNDPTWWRFDHIWLELERCLLGSPIYQWNSKEALLPYFCVFTSLFLSSVCTFFLGSFILPFSLLPGSLAHGWLNTSKRSLSLPGLLPFQWGLWALGQLIRWSDCLAQVLHMLSPGPGKPQSCSVEHAWMKSFSSRCFRNQPKWYWKDALPFK